MTDHTTALRGVLGGFKRFTPQSLVANGEKHGTAAPSELLNKCGFCGFDGWSASASRAGRACHQTHVDKHGLDLPNALSEAVQRLTEVRDQIIGVFNAAAHPHQVVTDADFVSGLWVHPGVGAYGGTGNQ